MRIALSALSLVMQIQAPWSADWIWGCPLIILTVTVHVLGLGFISQRAVLVCNNILKRRPIIVFALVMGATILLAIILHGTEAGIWALAYCDLGAIPDFKSAMLYSLGAMTTYGHDELFLAPHWRLLGTIEALNGWLLFGLSSAFLFWLIQEASPRVRAEHR